MSKLALPVAELLGSPLSSDELKSIVGGYSTTYICECKCEGTVNNITTTLSENIWYNITEYTKCESSCTSFCEEGTGGTPDWVFRTTTRP